MAITHSRARSKLGDIGIGELSKRTGVHIETIRYYERIGIMPKPPRSEGGHRVYDEGLTRRLGFISRSRQLGFTLEEIRGLLSLVDENEYTCADVRELTLEHAAEVKSKIADLKKLERVLRNMAAQCHGKNVPDCPIVDALFDAKQHN